jgi:hypothetical protein
LLLAFAVAVQALAGWRALGADLAGEDPPAHFTTGVLLYDYARRLAPAPPMRFAECFYVQYPKVAFGHWPPVFYIAECFCFLIFGASIAAARWLCAAIAAGLAAVLWRQCRKHWGDIAGPVAAALFLTFPVIQAQAWRVMSDVLLALFLYLALSRFAAWLSGEPANHLWWCALWTSLAILTKATGWLMLPVLLSAPWIAGRAEAYRRRAYWLATALVCAVTTPFFLAMKWMYLGYPVQIARQLRGLANGAPALPALAALLLAGAAFLIRRHPARTPSQTVCVTMGLWLGAQTAFLIVLPHVPGEYDRFFIASLAPGIFLFSGVLYALESRVARYGLPRGALTAICGGAAMLWFGVAPDRSVRGYAAAIDSIPRRATGPVVWVQSDPVGDGAVIARRLETDRARSTYIVRGSKMIADQTWSGRRYTLRYREPQSVLALLERIPVDYILFDTSAPSTPDADLLGAALASPQSKFALRSSLPIRGWERSGEVRIYQRRSPVREGPVALSVMLGPEHNHRAISCPARPW